MTKIYEMWDHQCEGSKKLAEQKTLYFEGYACWCSPIERHYKMDYGGKTYHVNYCPCCGDHINPYGTYLAVAPHLNKIILVVPEV